MNVIESKFVATTEQGEVSSLLIHPDMRTVAAGARAWCKHKYAKYNPSDHRRTVGGRWHRYIPVQLPLFGTGTGPKFKRRLSGNCAVGSRSGTHSGK